jgi:hypothetical protein
MKNFVKWFEIIAFVAAIGFSAVSCQMEEDNDYELLNGDWDRGDIIITFNDDKAVFTQINSDSGWKAVQNNGSIHIGDTKIRNIKKTDNRKWTGQELTYDPNTNTKSNWVDCTLTVDANGQTLHDYAPDSSTPYTTYTRK